MKQAPKHLNRHQQQGATIVIAMIALVALLTASIALFRSTDTANAAAANFQFVKSAEQNLDLGMNEAMRAYAASSANAALNITNQNTNAPTVRYWSQEQAANAVGIPTLLANAPTPSWNTTGPVATGWPGEQIDNTSRQLRRYFIERLCNQPGVGIENNCRMYVMSEGCWSDPCPGVSEDRLPFIRVTVRVDGPKGAVAYSQMFIKGI
jgi:type II secretory pathway pseudopilin PulG